MDKRNLLIVGSGGREHALGWKLAQSPHVNKVFFAPGNGGTENNVDIKIDDIDKLADFASKNNCTTVVGPEMPLSLGIADEFSKNGLEIFGPTKNAAKLEGSKIFSKNFMRKYGINTAKFESFDNADEAKEYAKSVDYKLVVKADGLASGKGVAVCNNTQEVFDAVDKMLLERAFGDASSKIILEERIDGKEVSFIAISDGNSVVSFDTSKDHKRVFDKNRGPNTGGMGAYSPVDDFSEELYEFVQEEVVRKTVSSMKKEGCKFKGFLYAGLMIKDNVPYVLEFNTRMGDPECQALLFRMESDLFPYIDACIKENLSDMKKIKWKKEKSVCVVLASKGYPGNYPKGDEIKGLGEIDKNAFVFHSGTAKRDNKIITEGGRVLGVTALGDTVQEAAKKVYAKIDKINWPNKYYRQDIGPYV